MPDGLTVVDDLPALLALDPVFVVEAAGQAAVPMLDDVLKAGIPALVVSTGAFAEGGVLERMKDLAARYGTRLLLSAGAIAGLDYLDAAALGTNLQVRYTSRKPPAAWQAELAALGHDPAEPAILFEGSAEEAARRYPHNLNVALTLRLRLGPAIPLSVRVIADPAIDANTHEIKATGSLGAASLRFANAPAQGNPKTSALTGHSLAAEIRRMRG